MSSRWLTNEDETAPTPVNLNHLVRNATYDAANHKIVLQKHDNITMVDVDITTLGAHDTSLTQHSNSITALENAGYQTQTQVDSNITSRGYQTSSDVSTTVTNSIADCYENATISGTGVFSGTVPTSISINSGPWGTAGNSYDGVAEAMAEQWGTVI